MSFKVLKKSKKTAARYGSLTLAHGQISTPAFMPIATKGAVKNLIVEELRALGAEIILSNTYHLWLRPGLEILKKAGGLHRFMRWSGPILTDSGGYQVFSLTKFRQLSKEGVKFRDPLNGELRMLTPELAMHIQQVIGSDIMMVLDECPPYPSSKEYAEKSLALTLAWAQRCKSSRGRKKQLLFGIIQGGTYPDLRRLSAQELVKLNFDGYAHGGLAVGEPPAKMYQMIKVATPYLPPAKPRYLMGVGLPEQILRAVSLGVDMFDCVIPTREARHGRLYLVKGERLVKNGRCYYTTINITAAKFAQDQQSINQANLKEYSRAYLHHLFRTNEPLAMRLATLNNLYFYLRLMREIREQIQQGKL